MPLDASGTFRHNHESAQMHSEAVGKKYDPGSDPGHGEEKGEHMEVIPPGSSHPGAHPDLHVTIHHKEDGSEPERIEHETIGHMHAHLSKHFGEEGHQHFHAHHDGVEAHSHSVETGGEPEHREHDMANLEGLKDHFSQFVNEEENEPAKEGGEEESKGEGLEGLY